MSEQTYALSADAAEFYEATFVPALFRQWAERLARSVPVQPGGSVLDVACGTGVVTRLLADRVGPDGHVVGLDLNDAMLAVARRLRSDLRWQEGDACALPFPDGSFDLVVSQAALMFFGDRVAALREMGRVSNGRIAVQVPGRLTRSPGYLALTRVVADHAGPDAVDLLGAYFAVGEPDQLTTLFESADLRIDRFDTWIGATELDSIDTFLAVELLPIADQVDDAVRDRITRDARTALAPFVDHAGAVSAPIEVHLITAHRT
jgi:ubiquinone/menaquinone biosynthesis C-methylase UbiE